MINMSNDARRLHNWLLTLGAISADFAISRRAFLRSIDAVISDAAEPLTRERFYAAWRSLRTAGLVHVRRTSVWAES
jgi:hypothetical protein